MADVLPRATEDPFTLELQDCRVRVPAPGKRSRLAGRHRRDSTHSDLAAASPVCGRQPPGSRRARLFGTAGSCLPLCDSRVALRAPPLDVEDGAVATRVVLDADVVVLAGRVEEAAGGLGIEVVQRRDANAAVAQRVVVGPVRQAVPDVVVPGTVDVVARAAVLLDDPVPRPAWYAMLSGMLNCEEPCTNNCTCGTAVFASACATVPSVKQTASPPSGRRRGPCCCRRTERRRQRARPRRSTMSSGR